MKSIKTKITSDRSITIPGSKSISHRMLICAAMADGTSIIRNILQSEDIHHTISALSKMGAVIEEITLNESEDKAICVTGFNGELKPYDQEIYLGNSGTSMRLLAGVAALGKSPYTLTGDKRMQERPMGDLLDALNMAGAEAISKKGDGTPPVVIKGGNTKNLNTIGGNISLDCSQSSQYLSAMLMMGALLPDGLFINLPGPTVSAPYVDLTIDVMKKFGVTAKRIDDKSYKVHGAQHYRAGDFSVEPDISNASYFWAAGAVTGKKITVTDINQNSLQGDRRLLDILEQMGCNIEYYQNGIGVCGNRFELGLALNGVEVDMSDIPDVVPTLAVVAAFAKGRTKIVNIAHLREKECDRISAVVSGLRKIGIEASEGEDWLAVTGSRATNQPLNGARIETFNDHRIAMAFSIAGLVVDGIEIENEGCVAKSFPNYWEKFES
ncbi:MAG: 3-phosphoshikimate 1-carboxyvinyltransferase, partial [Desulfamplus sp.]|nr:3-phosphoshikimate 1-carboxyvinyltransferase [Desulfamplus sp.]